MNTFSKSAGGLLILFSCHANADFREGSTGCRLGARSRS